MKIMLEKLKMKINQAIKYITDWLKCHVNFSKAIPFISGLIFVHSWIEYALIAILITHLTDQGLRLSKAAMIVNVHDGVTELLVLVVDYASEAYLGPFIVIVCTNVAYIIGLLLLFLAAWVLHEIEIKLLYVALLLIAIGRAGCDVPLKEFLADQFRKQGRAEDEERVESRRKIWWRLAYFIGIIASLVFFTEASWVNLCKICTIALAIAFALFLGGIPIFELKKPTESSSLNKVVQVIKAAILKRHLSLNTTVSSDNDSPIIHSPMKRLLSRWLDRAAIVESLPSLEDDEEENLRVCTVEQVHEVKFFLRMVPLWTTLIAHGLLQATGNTFFYEQVGYMESSYIPIVIFVIIRTSTTFIVSPLCRSLRFPAFWPGILKVPRNARLVRIGVGLAISPLCCVIATNIEAYRKQQNLDADNPISVLWLIPQFFLLGLMDGLIVDGMDEFFYAEVPQSFNNFGQQFTLSIGNFLGLPFTLIFHSYLTDDLNTSKLGAYYAVIAGVCFLNLMFYCYLAYSYTKGEEPAAAIGLQEICGDQEQVEISGNLHEA